jgi:hypothetical protein
VNLQQHSKERPWLNGLKTFRNIVLYANSVLLLSQNVANYVSMKSNYNCNVTIRTSATVNIRIVKGSFNRTLRHMLVVTQPVSKFPAFCGTRKFIIVFTRASQCFLSRSRWGAVVEMITKPDIVESGFTFCRFRFRISARDRLYRHVLRDFTQFVRTSGRVYLIRCQNRILLHPLQLTVLDFDTV